MNIYAYIAMSLDGFIAGPGGELDWLSAVEQKGEDYGFSKFYESIDTMVLGRNTYDIVCQFPAWPYSGKKCIVFTSKPKEQRNGESFFSGNILELYDFLKSSGAENVYADGGKLIQSFIKEGLIDAITVSVIPVILGEGIPLFGKMDRRMKLHLSECIKFPSGLVQIKYTF